MKIEDMADYEVLSELHKVTSAYHDHQADTLEEIQVLREEVLRRGLAEQIDPKQAFMILVGVIVHDPSKAIKLRPMAVSNAMLFLAEHLDLYKNNPGMRESMLDFAKVARQRIYDMGGEE